MKNMESKSIYPVVCFGEVLWDILPSGAVPGGAPMNVAYHLKKQKVNTALITRIGNDEKGERLLHILSNYNVCTDYFQMDETYETGKVIVNTSDITEVTYDIVMPVAWDFIEWLDKMQELVAASQFFVFGSLAARNRNSRNTLFCLLDAAKTKILDINLRAPHFNQQLVGELLQRADFVKMNLAELELITGWFSKFTSIEDRIKSIRDRFSIGTIVVTMGGDGALLYIDDGFVKHNGFKVNVVDTVGSGDAFLAAFLTKLLENATPAHTLDFASKLGAFVATQRGACPQYETTRIDDLLNVAH